MATTLQTIGGNRGNDFSFTGLNNGATLKKIGVAVAEWQIKAVRAELTDGRVQQFGNAVTFQEYEFGLGERITKLSLWDNTEGRRLGALKFWTSEGNQFFAKMHWGLKTEVSIDVGSGVCLGLVGRSGADIDCLGFLFINAIESSVLTDMTYPTLAMYKPQVQKEYIKAVSYKNATTMDQEQTFEYNRSVKKSTTWTNTSKFDFNVSMSVQAGIPDLVQMSTGYSLTLGNEQSTSTSSEETITESDSIKVLVPAGKTATVEVSVGRAVIKLDYSAKVKIKCKNGSELAFDAKGQYKGVAYTAVDVKTTEF